MNFITRKIGKLILKVFAVVGLLVVIFSAGKRTERKDNKIKEMQSDMDKVRKINATRVHSNRGDAVERLRDNGQLRD
jgi:hypothetical protein